MKALPLAPPPGLFTPMQICVPCHNLSFAGGLFRFERFGRVARAWGHRVAFVRLCREVPPLRASDLEIIDFETAATCRWDATMVPGAGFPDETIAALARFLGPDFGLRVQHILNGPERRPRFLAVNTQFRPEVVVINNRQWSAADLAPFQGACHVLEGAVDSQHFRPDPARRDPAAGTRFRIGGQSRKNPAPLLEAVRALDDVELHLFGMPSGLEQDAADLIAAGRLRLLGPVEDARLPDFYRGLDCVVHTEAVAGWANLAAETLASQVPLVCTPHGTRAFAEHEVTALVIAQATPAAILAAIRRLRADAALADRIARTGRARMAQFSWDSYAAGLLEILRAHAGASRTPDA